MAHVKTQRAASPHHGKWGFDRAAITSFDVLTEVKVKTR